MEHTSVVRGVNQLGRGILRAICAGVAVLSLAALARAQVTTASTWTQPSVPTTADLWSVCYGNGRFVAVGTGGTILTSPDGLTWTSQASGTTNWLVAVANCDGRFIAVGDQGIILTSSDGVTWTQRASGGPRLNGVADIDNFGGNTPTEGDIFTIVAVGQNGATMTSADGGMTWTAGSAGTTNWLHGITGMFGVRAVGQAGTVVTSSDGTTFAADNAATDNDLQAIASIGFGAGSAYFIVGNGGYLATTDPVAWTQLPVPVTVDLNALCQSSWSGASAGGNDQVIIVGNQGTVLVAQDPASSYDLRWQIIPTSTTENLLGVCSSPTQVVVVGQGGTILTSPVGLGDPEVLSLTQLTAPVQEGSSVQLSASVIGVGPITYQWALNGQSIAGATGPTLTLASIQYEQSGTYTVTATNAMGSSSAQTSVSAIYVPTMPGLVDESLAPQAAPSTLPVVILPDGGFIAGTSRYNADGSAAFQMGTDAATTNVYVLEPNGQIVLVQYFEPFHVSPYSQAIRYNADGSVDPTFTPNAAVNSNGDDNQYALPCIALVNGDFLSFVSFDTIVRLQPNGLVDSNYTPLTLTSSGLAATTWTPDLNATAITGELVFATDPVSGKIWVGGGYPNIPSGTAIYRLNADGTADPTFSIAVVPNVAVAGMTIQNGQLLYWGTNGSGGYVAGRLTADGVSDPTYGPVALPAPAPASMPYAYGPDGSLYVDFTLNESAESLGQNVLNYPTLPLFAQTYREGIVRFDPNGNFDPTFSLNLDGTWPPNVTTADSQITGMAFAPDGQLYVWGTFTRFNGENHSAIVRLNLSAAQQHAVLANLSARAIAGPGAQALTGGFVIGNSGTKSMLLRGVGPALASFGVADALPDPELTLYNGAGQAQLTATHWSSSPQASALADAALAVGAFALPSGSADAAVLESLGNGSNTFTVGSVSGDSGTALVEMYDADTPPLSYGAPQLINVSARANVTPGNPLIGGFIVTQGNTKRVLLRAIGPTLAQFGVANVLPDPVLTLYSGQTEIAAEQGWSAWAPLLQPTFSAVGAFSLPASSNDSALVITLPPGQYSAQVTSASGDSGEAMVEIYEVP